VHLDATPLKKCEDTSANQCSLLRYLQKTMRKLSHRKIFMSSQNFALDT